MKGKPEVQIDWSKAPEGTTHANIEAGPHSWRMVIGEHAFYWAHNCRWERLSSWHLCEYVERPKANNSWNGDGLPPAGTVCEWLDQGSDRWLTVEIVFLSSWVIVVRHSNPHPDGSVDLAFDLINQQPSFRPIRNVEQIAAEERKERVSAACKEIEPRLAEFNINIDCSVAMRAAIEALLDAGYRKTGGGAQ